MADQKRTAREREIDLVDIARMWCNGKTAYAIRDWLNANRPYQLSRQQVQYDIGKLLDRWHAEEMDMISKRKWAEVARYEHIYEQAMDAWEKSKRDRVTKFQNSKEIDGVGGESKNISVQVSITDGNTAFLQAAMNARARIAEILGLDAPTKSEITGADGKPLETGAIIILPDNGRGTANIPSEDQTTDPSGTGAEETTAP